MRLSSDEVGPHAFATCLVSMFLAFGTVVWWFITRWLIDDMGMFDYAAIAVGLCCGMAVVSGLVVGTAVLVETMLGGGK